MPPRYRRCLPILAAWVAVAVPSNADAEVTATPDPSGLPGTAKLQQLVNGMYLWVLLLTLAALVVAATVWAWGSHSNNVRAASDGRRGVGVALLAALIVGAAPMLVNWFYRLGR